ncbi:lipocalin-like domain-containing protein [Sphingobium sp.]|uniref:lipocalin-like domain-containing protein n=1 Tax=Sphingobium sp. TaxID=1912891 RepID=UPI0035C7135E
MRDPVEQFVGAWQLVLWTTHRADGTEIFPFGRDALGQILYSADGHMSCHLMMANRPPLGAPSIYDVDDATLGQAIRAYSGYFGRYSVDAQAGIVTHHVDGAWYPDWIGSIQPRRFRFEGDRLFLEAEVGADLIRIKWRRKG